MKSITLFYLEICPYCMKARRAIDELLKERPAFNDVHIDWVEESREPERAERYDYNNVPTVYFGEEKLYEARPGQGYSEIKEALRRSLETALCSA